MTPDQYPRRILLAVAGLSPQIVTETVYALATHTSAPFIPTEIRLITTTEGAQRARLALLSEDPGWFHRLRKDYRLPPIEFDESHIHVLTDAQDVALDDIRSPSDNRACADYITSVVRDLTADPDAALHVSIAGGRKTMGFFLGYALSLFARPQDRLSHVLVSEPFESSWEFFYPTPYPRVISTRDNKIADSQAAEVTLAEIPFVPLRHGLPNDILLGKSTYADAVEAVDQSLGPPKLEIDIGTRQINAGGKFIKLPPGELTLYLVFAKRALKNEEPLPPPHKALPDMEWAKRYQDELRRAIGTLGIRDETEQELRSGMSADYFSQKLSKLHARLRKTLGATATSYCLDGGNQRRKAYRLSLPPEAIQIIDSRQSASLR